MDFKKYSIEQFEMRSFDAAATRKLADDLEEDVNQEIHDAVFAAFKRVVDHLNAEGHNLTPYYEMHAGDISYQDVPIGGKCHLRLGCDVVISAGYADTLDR